MTMATTQIDRILASERFRNERVTATGEVRASVDFRRLETVWFNTGTRCNLACRNCYIESSPRNDRLVYISRDEVAGFLEEIQAKSLGTNLIGFTGGEPFMNPGFTGMLEDVLDGGYRSLVLTNAMLPMWRRRSELLRLAERHGNRLDIRVSVDHYSPQVHEAERGANSWAPMLRGLCWLRENGFSITVAGRNLLNEPESGLRDGFEAFFRQHGLPLDATDPADLVIFPEMDVTADVPEITSRCWDLLSVSPDAQMCASARMVVKRKGADRPVVVACTLLPYDELFELGHTLSGARRPIWLNHPHCARFCVLGGASCQG